MSFQVPRELIGVVGSRTRAKVLGYLANSTTPQTGYAIARNLRINVSKVYGELKRLEPTGVLSVRWDAKGSRRFLLQDEDLRAFVAKRVRISSAEEWFSPGKVAERRRALREAQRIAVSLPPLGGKPDRGSPIVRELRRPLAKDRVLSRTRRAAGAGRLR